MDRVPGPRQGGRVRFLPLILVLAALIAPTPASAYVYWGQFDADIGRANNDGTGVERHFISAPCCNIGLAVDGSHLYWGKYDYSPYGPVGTVGRANLDGSGVNGSLVTGIDLTQGVAVHGSHVYWFAQRGAIGRANLDGTHRNYVFMTGLGNGSAVAVDDAHIYWTMSDTHGW